MVIFHLTICLYAKSQGFKHDLEKIYTNYHNDKAVNLSLEYKLYDGHNITKLLDSSYAQMVILKDICYTKMDDVEMITNENHQLVVFHQMKKMVVSKLVQKSEDAFEVIRNLNEADYEIKETTFKGGNKRIRVYAYDGGVDSLDIVYNGTTFKLKHVLIFFNSDYLNSSEHPNGNTLMVRFMENKSGRVNFLKSKLSFNYYVKQNNSLFKPTDRYSDYSIIDNY